MDFSLSETEQTIVELTERVLGDKSSHERLKALAAADDRVDREAWSALAATGVLAASIPEDHGGLGLGFLATAMALEPVGWHASPVPLLSTILMAALPIAEFGSEAQKQAWLPAIADGSLLACAALAEDESPAWEPRTTARPRSDGYVLDGTKVLVAGGLDADIALVPAQLLNGEVGVFVVPLGTARGDVAAAAGGAGLEVARVEVTTGRPEARLELRGAEVGREALLGAAGSGTKSGLDGTRSSGTEIVKFIVQRANIGLCMMMAGAARSAIGLAAAYTKQRHQFDRPIATFQAVSQRAGDSYIDAEAIALSAYQAAWRVSVGLPAEREIAIAKYWACEGGFRVVHAAVHVHGGVGVDRDYPLHRHFLLARLIELTLGHAEEQLAELGRLIAAG